MFKNIYFIKKKYLIFYSLKKKKPKDSQSKNVV